MNEWNRIIGSHENEQQRKSAQKPSHQDSLPEKLCTFPAEESPFSALYSLNILLFTEERALNKGGAPFSPQIEAVLIMFL